MHYDAVSGNLDSTLAPGNRFTKLTFDGYGRVVRQQSNDEPQRQVVYDALNRVREVLDGVNASPTKYSYDQQFLTRVVDPKGQIFRFEYNALGWVTRKYDPADTLSRFDSFAYDSAGNVRRWNNRRGQQVSYTYDALNRPLSKTGTNTSSDSLWYSADGLRMASWNSSSTDSIYFRANGWVDSAVTLLGGKRFKRAYTPTSVQRLDAVTITNNAGITFAPRRFAWNSLTGALDTAYVNGQATGFSRNREMLPIQTVWPSISRTNQWTAIHRPGEQSYSNSTVNTALFRRYGYDSRSGLRDRIRKSGAIFIDRQAGYDGLRRLGNQGEGLFPTGSCPWDVASGYLCPEIVDHQVTFDPGGNRTDAANATYATGNRIQSFGSYTFAHDLDGNLTQKYNTATSENKQFEWSSDGRLTRVLVDGTERVRYDYNASGVLVRRWTNGVLDRHFLWDQGHLLAELDGAATQRIAEYAHLPGADHPLALVTGAQAIASVRYLVQDETGNVIGLLNGATLDQQVAYDDWGMPSITGSTDNRLLFKGLLWESTSTGMYYIRARWYDPELGRFASEDPCGLADGTNLYTFAGNDAINGHDPSGCISLKKILNGVGKVAKVIAPLALPALAFGPGGLLAASKALGATALGSAVSAGIEHLRMGEKFWRAFHRSFSLSASNLAIGAIAGHLGAGIVASGANSPFQGYVRLAQNRGGFTLGSAAQIWAPQLAPERYAGLDWAGEVTNLFGHELGHTFQFMALSGGKDKFGMGPWLPYGALGILGLAGRPGGSYNPIGIVGCPWEWLAGAMGWGTSSCNW